MSRKMDHRVHDIDELRRTRNDATKLRRELRELELKQSTLENKLLKSMRNSTVGTVNGEVVVTVEDTERRSVLIKTVETVAPDLFDKLVTVKKSKKVKIKDV